MNMNRKNLRRLILKEIKNLTILNEDSKQTPQEESDMEYGFEELKKILSKDSRISYEGPKFPGSQEEALIKLHPPDGTKGEPFKFKITYLG